MTLERCCTGMTSFARSATSGSTEPQSSPGTDLMSLSCRSRLTPTFRPGGFQRDLATGRCTQCWSARPEKPDCRSTGIRAFPIRGAPWPLPSGPGGISHAVSPSYTRTPGAGFDVVPSDCLAAYVASKLERPASLVIALRGLESASQGTLRTAIRQVSKPVLCRRARAIVALDDRSVRWIDFGSGDEPCVPVSWGDVATAFHSTGVGKITVYFRRTTLFRLVDIVAKLFGPFLRSRIGQRGLAAIVRSLSEGSSQAERIGHHGTIWAEAIDCSAKCSKARLFTPDAYELHGE